MAASRIRTFWPAGVALVVAGVLGGLFSQASRAYRLSDLDLSGTGYPNTYIMRSKSEPSRCYVVDRRDATMRRSDGRQPGRKWDLVRIGADRIDTDTQDPRPATWLVQAKRKGTGTVFFVPVDDVPDWTYPFLYRFVQKHAEELDLPAVGWTQLYVDRIYEGLYLRVALPFDPRKKDNGPDARRELLTVRGGRLTRLDTRLDPDGRLYNRSVAEGVLPTLSPPPEALCWLARRCPTEGTTFLLSNRAPHDLTLLPLPISVAGLYEALHGRLPNTFEDERYRRWTNRAGAAESGDPLPFSDQEWAVLQSDFQDYAASFRKALRIHGEFHQTLDTMRAYLPERQGAVAGLPLSLGELSLGELR